MTGDRGNPPSAGGGDAEGAGRPAGGGARDASGGGRAPGAGAVAAGRVPWPEASDPFPEHRGVRGILVVKTSALGDVIHSLPSLYALRSLFPEARIAWAVEPRFSDLLPGPPWIDDLVLFRKAEMRASGLIGKFRALADMRRAMRPMEFDLALDLQGLMKSTLVALLSGAARRLGYCEMREGSRLFTRPVTGPNRSGHVIQRYLDVVRSLGPVPDEVRFPLPDCSPEREVMRSRLLEAGAAGPLALLFPGAGWRSKLWPAAFYARLAGDLQSWGMTVALGGGPGDGPLAREIISLAGTPAGRAIPDLTGATDIRGLMGLTSLASVCAGADTGPLHLAAAQGTPTVSLFGPSSGERAGTWGPAARYVAAGVPCSPCFKRDCPRKDNFCMESIGPPAVLERLREVLGLFPPASLAGS
ncbi:MAG: glycosyltransferase family 9 protein [Deltaproteobacteria bacterium]|nr:glycosyltransferase family 9 protein [Deltaproteobacteria bacterium]